MSVPLDTYPSKTLMYSTTTSPHSSATYTTWLVRSLTAALLVMTGRKRDSGQGEPAHCEPPFAVGGRVSGRLHAVYEVLEPVI